LAIGAAVAVCVGVLAIILARLYVDWLWFGEVGLRTVFWKRLAVGGVTAVGFGAAFFAVVYGNLVIARRLAPKYRPVEGVDVIEAVHETALRWVGRAGLLAALLGAFIAARSAAGSWLVFARALEGVPFGLRDPIFHHDLAFYVFRLPAWEYAYGFLFASLIVALILSIAAHLAVGGIEVQMRESARPADLISRVGGLHIEEGAAIHLSALMAALFILGGVGYLFRAWNLLYSTAGVVYGVGYTDLHVRLPMIRVLMVLVFVLAGALIYNAAHRRHPWWPAAAVGVWLVQLLQLLGLDPGAAGLDEPVQT
jgi:hypothetical protein